MKQKSALLSALIITAVIGLGMLLLSVNALLNKNTVPVSNSPAQVSSVDPTQGSTLAQYQTELAAAQQQLDQANNQIQQYQSLLLALQQRGVIMIGRDGNIYIPSNNTP
jgi:peptidoglycan hydrolase CwlO-like protein